MHGELQFRFIRPAPIDGPETPELLSNVTPTLRKNVMISTLTKYRIKAPFRYVGLDLVARRPYPLQFLASYNIETILDVGAHEGGFAEEVRMILPNAMLHSFEPVRETFKRLKRRRDRDPKFKAWNVAIGDRTGEATIGVNSLTASSSFLSLGTITDHCPATAVLEQQPVEILTLDDWCDGVQLQEPMVLKADVQGFEGHVLAGATQLLKRVAVVILEVSFEQVYHDQPLFGTIYDQMRNLGFEFKGLYDSWCDPRTARQIQSNAIFERS
jgi:FkbM family methyltransferase